MTDSYKKARSNAADSYASYVKKYGEDLSEKYGEERRDAYSEFIRSSPGYGSGAETLASSSLSGYAGYISSLSDKNYRDRLRKIKDSETAAQRKQLSGYADYLADYEQRQNSYYLSAVKNISDAYITDLTAAYRIAAEAGLDDKRASAAAAAGVAAAKERQDTDILNAIVKNKMSYAAAYNYALELGIGEERAKAIADKSRDYLGDEQLTDLSGIYGSLSGGTDK